MRRGPTSSSLIPFLSRRAPGAFDPELPLVAGCHARASGLSRQPVDEMCCLNDLILDLGRPGAALHEPETEPVRLGIATRRCGPRTDWRCAPRDSSLQAPRAMLARL